MGICLQLATNLHFSAFKPRHHCFSCSSVLQSLALYGTWTGKLRHRDTHGSVQPTMKNSGENKLGTSELNQTPHIMLGFDLKVLRSGFKAAEIKNCRSSRKISMCHSGFFPTGSSSRFSFRDWGDHILLLHALILKLLPFGHPILQENCHKRNKLHWRIGLLVNLIETRWWIQKSSEIDQISLAIKHATSKGVNAFQKCDLTHPLKPSWCTCGTWSCTWNSPTVLNIEIDVGSGYVEV